MDYRFRACPAPHETGSGSNSVTFIDTATNTVKRTTDVGCSPHEAFYTREGKEVWVIGRLRQGRK